MCLLLGISSVFPCSMRAWSSVNVRVRAATGPSGTAPVASGIERRSAEDEIISEGVLSPPTPSSCFASDSDRFHP
jgi:hypothetical protein